MWFSARVRLGFLSLAIVAVGCGGPEPAGDGAASANMDAASSEAASAEQAVPEIPPAAAQEAVPAAIDAPALSAEARQQLAQGAQICAAAHVQNIGWQDWRCVGDGALAVLGTTGQSLRMEALMIGTPKHGLCGRAHVQNIGWQAKVCKPAGSIVTVGTTGRSLRMEALALELL